MHCFEALTAEEWSKVVYLGFTLKTIVYKRLLLMRKFVVGSRLAPRVFLRVLRFSSILKTKISQLLFDLDREPAWKPAFADVTSSVNIAIYERKHYWPRLICGEKLSARLFKAPSQGKRNKQIVKSSFSLHGHFRVHCCSVWGRITNCGFQGLVCLFFIVS